MLDASHLDYPRRALGPDHDLFEWSCLFDRPAITWPGGARVAIVVVVDVESFPLTATDHPFRAPSHMQTPYPDLRNASSRDYGLRVGLYRMLDVFADLGIRVSFAVNSRIATRFPTIIRDLVAGGHAIIAHATDMNATIATGLAEADERAIISAALDTLEQATGARPRGWLSIDRSQSWNTPALLAEAGVLYQCDWVNDELPYRMTTPSGPLINLPLNHELSDRQVMLVQRHLMASYCEQLLDAHRWLDAEATAPAGGRMLPINLTPYVSGVPHRIAGLRDLLATLARAPGAWFATADEVVASWAAQTD